MTILFAYDGSESADAAIPAARDLLAVGASMRWFCLCGSRWSSRRSGRCASVAGFQ